MAETSFAFEFTDERGGLVLTVDTRADERFCVALPRGHRDDAGCEGYEPSVLDEMADAPTDGTTKVGVGVLRKGDNVVSVLVQRYDKVKSFVPKRDGELFSKGLFGALTARIQGASIRRSDQRVKAFGGRDVHEATADLDIPETSPLRPAFGRVSFFTFAAGDVVYSVSVCGAAENAAHVDEVGNRIMLTLQGKPGRDSLEQSRAYHLGRAIGSFLAAAIPLIGLAVLIIVALRWRRRTPTQPPYPGAQSYHVYGQPPPGSQYGVHGGPPGPQEPNGPNPPARDGPMGWAPADTNASKGSGQGPPHQ
ncbi:MAG: hypothetical protein HOW73_24755 [Polyangiaceae bacterium]|nr:hypothetical protein [Polyangiaceae bacterium]